MSARRATCELLRRYATLFWDFDGVIKESVTVKSDAFERLFAPFGPELAARVREHHEHHGGMPRSEKLPLYLRWAGCVGSRAEVAHYAELFSSTVRETVIGCSWVAGAREYLQAHHRRQRFVLVTATPQDEISYILEAVGAAAWFAEVHGTPAAKAEAIAAVLGRLPGGGRDALMIGDSEADLAAAAEAGVDFLLRRTPYNRSLQRAYAGAQCEDFLDA